MNQGSHLRLPHRHASLLVCCGLLAGLVISLAVRPSSGHAADAPNAAPLVAPAPRSAVSRALGFAVTIEGSGVYGSGVLVAPGAGLVVTAAHVVAEMKRPQVTFNDGASFPAQVLDTDRGLDLALLSIPPQPGRPAPEIGDPLALDPGEEVFAVGCPRHLPFSVARGVVSYNGRPMDGARWLQTDTPINDGNSGGPVVDRYGRLVGITSFVLKRAQGLSFALPIPYALERFPRTRPLAAADLDRFQKWRGPLPSQIAQNN